MLELVDMPGTSQICRICRLGTSNPKQVGGGFRGPFCVPTEGVLKLLFGDQFGMVGGPLRIKPTPMKYLPQKKKMCPSWRVTSKISTSLNFQDATGKVDYMIDRHDDVVWRLGKYIGFCIHIPEENDHVVAAEGSVDT